VWGDGYYATHCAQSQQRTSPARLLGAIAIVLGAIVTVLGLATTAGATKPNPAHKITLCHRTDSYSNPYVVITVDIASVKFEGHNGHDGPGFFPGIPKHEKWGDIIPPFDFGSNGSYPGKNWTAAGIAIFDHQCQVITPTTTTAPGSTTASSSSPPSTTPSSSTTPGSTTPGSTTPGSTTPGSTTPGSSTPRSSTPGSSTPGSSIEGTSITTTGQGTSETQGAIAATETTGGTTAPLAFTGGKAWGLVLLGVAMTLSGIAVLVRRNATRQRL
jgi:hypothetical protein